MSLAMLQIPLALVARGSVPSTQAAATAVSRRMFVQGAGLLAMTPGPLWAADVSIGSAGISAYEKLQLDNAISELSEAIELAKSKDSQLKPSLDSYLEVAKVVAASQTAKVSAPAVTAAGAELKRVVETSGREGYVAEAASIDKRGEALVAASKKADPGPAAVVATKLVVELTDLAYEWSATEKPLAEIVVDQRAKKDTVADEDISKTMKRQL